MELEQLAAEFPLGAVVRYWPFTKAGAGLLGKIISPPFEGYSRNTRPVSILVDNCPKAVRLDHAQRHYATKDLEFSAVGQVACALGFTPPPSDDGFWLPPNEEGGPIAHADLLEFVLERVLELSGQNYDSPTNHYLLPRRVKTCPHPWHNNPGLITPCPECGQGEEDDTP